uniref:Beta-lactamase domain-containing protein n=1 Tax=Panagrellus redivivus TaxID=6233 RepID=A0A7E4V5Z4_PANRE
MRDRLIRISTAFAVFLAAVKLLIRRVKQFIFPPPREVPIGGSVADQFKPVEQAFRKNLTSGWEPDGAALAIYHKGKLVVDLYGGYADAEAKRPWKADTLNIAFSSSKAVGALCVAMLVDRDLLTYDTLIVDFWPEFGQKGKETLTVNQVLSHMAGLAYIETPITPEIVADPALMSKVIEEAVPNWTPGKAVGYHAVTYGWIVDQIVRRVDPQKRSLGQFYRDEIKGDYDFHLGLPITEAHRVTRLRNAGILQSISEFCTNPNAINYPRYIHDFLTDGPLSKVERNPDWLRFLKGMTLNNPEYYTLEQCAFLGIGTARALAALFDKALIQKQLFQKQSTLDALLKPFVTMPDVITGALVPRGQGLMFTPYGNTTLIGHAGYGGQNVRVDLERELVFVYLSNGLKAGFGDSARTYLKLRDSIYDCFNAV